MNFETASIFTIAQMGTVEQLKEKIGKTVPESFLNEKEENLLHCAIRGRNTETFDFLVAKGKVFDTQNLDGETPLHYATKLVEKKFVYHAVSIMLEKGFDINVKDKYGNNPFFSAVINCDYEDYNILKLMLKYKPNVVTDNKFGMSAMKIALEDNNQVLIELLKELN